MGIATDDWAVGTLSTGVAVGYWATDSLSVGIAMGNCAAGTLTVGIATIFSGIAWFSAHCILHPPVPTSRADAEAGAQDHVAASQRCWPQF